MAQVQGPQAGVQQRPIPIGPFNPSKTNSEPERWICIYPAYLNALKTKREGRIVPKAKAIDNPSWKEICDVLKAAGYEPVAENKLYSRERSKEPEYRYVNYVGNSNCSFILLILIEKETWINKIFTLQRKSTGAIEK